MTDSAQGFSVVTPSFNSGEFLEETMNSVLREIQPGDEYVVIDAGSTDRTVEIIKKYESYLTFWVSEPDYGYADALAKGFEHTHAPYMCWINSNDLLLSGALRRVRSVLDSTGADLVYGDDLLIDANSRVIRRSSARVHSIRRMMLYGGWTPLQDACFWRRTFYERVGGINRSLSLAADYDLFLRMSSYGRTFYLGEPLSAFRLHEGQKSIGRKKEYKREREASRIKHVHELKVATSRRSVLEPLYWFLVRWRHYVGRHFHLNRVTRGLHISKFVVSK